MGSEIAFWPMRFVSFAFHVGWLPGCDQSQLAKKPEHIQYQKLVPCLQIWDSYADICL